MGGLRAIWRFLRALLHALGGWFTIVFVFPRLDEAARHARVQHWARRMLHLLGIQLRLHGQPPLHGPLLLVSNHISWLDILVLHGAQYCRFVSKSEVRHWPLVGTLATGGGTLYIERASRRDAMRVVHQMAASLQAGDIVAVFPEGTTTDGVDLLPFHANLIQAAVAVDAPVQPVGLQFLDVCLQDSRNARLQPCPGALIHARARRAQPRHCTAKTRSPPARTAPAPPRATEQRDQRERSGLRAAGAPGWPCACG
jgi:1-acyl-sn-glycerol-3-phosphate acyltransferase